MSCFSRTGHLNYRFYYLFIYSTELWHSKGIFLKKNFRGKINVVQCWRHCSEAYARAFPPRTFVFPQPRFRTVILILYFVFPPCCRSFHLSVLRFCVFAWAFRGHPVRTACTRLVVIKPSGSVQVQVPRVWCCFRGMAARVVIRPHVAPDRQQLTTIVQSVSCRSTTSVRPVATRSFVGRFHTGCVTKVACCTCLPRVNMVSTHPTWFHPRLRL